MINQAQDPMSDLSLLNETQGKLALGEDLAKVHAAVRLPSFVFSAALLVPSPALRHPVHSHLTHSRAYLS